jgi:hypothetical protein
MSVSGQIRWGREYIKRTYGGHPAALDYSRSGKLTVAQAESFCEEDEPPGKIFAAFDRGEKGVTMRPQDGTP